MRHKMTHKIALILLAAGSGNRAGDGIPKPYRPIHSKHSSMEKTLSFFIKDSRFDLLLIVIRKEDQDRFKQMMGHLNLKPEFDSKIQCIYGGNTRTESSFLALKTLKIHSIKTVLIHDIVRPFISKKLIDRLFEQKEHADGVIPVLPLTDSLKKINQKGWIEQAIPKTNHVIVQTPQLFNYTLLLEAYQKWSLESQADDDAEIAHQAGLTIKTVLGEKNNIKLTYSEDFMPSNYHQNQSFITVTGSGYDVHRLDHGNGIYMSGIFIKCPYQLIGHSDSDVVLHALTDAILGSCSLGDIGQFFPPTEPKWKDQDSVLFLEHALDLLTQNNAYLQHVDITIIAEVPKINPYRLNMRKRLSELLKLDLSFISLKATTTEGLGYVGQKQGIIAQAIVSVKRPEK